MFTIDKNTGNFKVEECAGTLICGTMRLQDIIPAFLDAIRATVEYTQLLSLPFGAVPSHAIDDDDSDWWMSEDAECIYFSILDVLDAYAPKGYYFGAHIGDGSDYGYWPIEEEA